MKKLRIKFDKNLCIGNKACMAVDSERWINNDDKVDLVDGKNEGGEIYTLEKEFDEDDAKVVIEGAEVCPVNAIGVVDVETNEDIVKMEVSEEGNKVVNAEYDDDKEFEVDPKGYFLIKVDREDKKIEVAFCEKPNEVSLTVRGDNPLEIYQTIINKEKLEIRKDHYAYLGKELEKAFIALNEDIEYVQDDELDFSKKV
ncbi:MAG: hypothetical protein CMH62_02685 [Nanoarchaeota archaeon]|nr:hypothetical protein [Nanoarchaeota archaeon]